MRWIYFFNLSYHYFVVPYDKENAALFKDLAVLEKFVQKKINKGNSIAMEHCHAAFRHTRAGR